MVYVTCTCIVIDVLSNLCLCIEMVCKYVLFMATYADMKVSLTRLVGYSLTVNSINWNHKKQMINTAWYSFTYEYRNIQKGKYWLFLKN